MTKVLLTRPEQECQALQQLLAADNIEAMCQPLFAIIPGRQLSSLAEQLAVADIVIAVSKHAVSMASRQLNQQWPSHIRCFAVGQATQQAWQQAGVEAIAPQLETSEGLLALPQLANVAEQRIVILRGQRGRELLAEQLHQRGADVSYCECYQREAITLNSSQLVPYWQQQISYLIITSGEQLNRLQALCDESQLPWLYSNTLITVSQRLADLARTMGFKQILVSASANNQALKATLLTAMNKAKSR
ncbi:uroporphyrinogen-III synthase [Neiella sp. HB171785]|uniref:Uroporphyrinogen-III synthase n=1 Tax=Neiella litorisoli TaxID=2771431 RepID=A0A8J6QGN0_9GAMM|nr:uroporphyrinogen-III synthase [Neiella litorisoli]MBD1388002.1 uroporphyrinogen-III synthase [Neiella litorisoli]